MSFICHSLLWKMPLKREVQFNSILVLYIVCSLASRGRAISDQLREIMEVILPSLEVFYNEILVYNYNIFSVY